MTLQRMMLKPQQNKARESVHFFMIHFYGTVYFDPMLLEHQLNYACRDERRLYNCYKTNNRSYTGWCFRDWQRPHPVYSMLRTEPFEYTGLTLGLCPANERRRYFVTTSLIGWAQTWHQPWIYNDGLVQGCSIFSALAVEILQYCAKPSISNLDTKFMWSFMG